MPSLTDESHLLEIAVSAFYFLDVPPEGEPLQMLYEIHGCCRATGSRFSGNGNSRFEFGVEIMFMESLDHAAQHVTGTSGEILSLTPPKKCEAIRLAAVKFFNIIEPCHDIALRDFDRF